MNYPKVGPFRVFALGGSIKLVLAVATNVENPNSGSLSPEEARELAKHLIGLADAVTKAGSADDEAKKAKPTYTVVRLNQRGNPEAVVANHLTGDDAVEFARVHHTSDFAVVVEELSNPDEGLQMNYDAAIEALLHVEHVEHFLLRQAQDAAEKHGDTETVQKIMEFRRERRLVGTDLPRTLRKEPR